MKWEELEILDLDHLKKLFTYWKGRVRDAEIAGGGEGGGESFTHWVHSPSDCHRWIWSRLKPGARNSILVVLRWQGPKYLPSPATFQTH